MKWILPAGALAIVIAAGAGAWAYMARPAAEVAVGATEITQIAGDAADIDVSGVEEMVLGDPDAPVEVIEYASYTCPHCARFHTGPFKSLKADYIDTGKVKFIYREVYFDKYGMWASLIARCGGAERFFGITDLIYKGQSEWARAGSDAAIADELRKIGRLAGIEDAALDACLQDGDKLRALVAWYQQNAQADGIQSTPSFVVNGELHSNMSYAEFTALLDSQIEE